MCISTLENDMGDLQNNSSLRAIARFQRANDPRIEWAAELLMSTKTWYMMNGIERKTCVRHLVSQVSSEVELLKILRTELGLKNITLTWWLPPEDEASIQARMLLKSLGGCVSGNGACVMIMTLNDQF
jgi:hypothetical protein